MNTNYEHLRMLEILALFALAVILKVTPAYADRYVTLDFPGATNTVVAGINNKQQVVGYFFEPNGKFHGFLWSRGQFTRIDYPGASTGTLPTDINDQGQIVGGADTIGFELDGDSFNEIIFPDSVVTFASGTNDGAEIVGSYQIEPIRFEFKTYGFTFITGLYESVSYEGFQTDLSRINRQDQIVGCYRTDTGTYHGLLLSGGAFTAIDYPGSDYTIASGINDQSQIVGSYSLVGTGGPYRGFALVGERFFDINFPRAASTEPSDIDSKGNVVGSYIDANNHYHGFIRIRSGN